MASDSPDAVRNAQARQLAAALDAIESCLDRLGPGHVFESKRVAIATIVPQLEDDICARCTVRVFDECRFRPGGAEAAPPPG